MVEKNIVKEWFRYANMDLDTVDNLMYKMYPVPYEIVCYHCQQAAEKYLKGYIIYHDLEPPKIHDLIELLRICDSLHTGFSSLVKKCALLTKFSVLPRYPNELQISEGDAKFCLRYANDIKEFVKKLVDSDISET